MAIPDHVILPLTAQTAAATSYGGPGSGWIPASADAVAITSSASTKFMVVSNDAPQGKQVWGNVGANGFKLQTLAGSTQTINNVDCSSTAVAVIPANATFLLVKSLTTGWILSYYTNLGAVGTAIVPA